MVTTPPSNFNVSALWQTIQPLQRLFLRRVLLSMAIWFVLDFWLPLDQPLTMLIVRISQWMTGVFLSESPNVVLQLIPFEGYTMYDNATKMNIAHTCNGKAILFLFTAFLWAIPNQTFWKRTLYSVVGFVTLSLANALRIAALFLVSKQLPQWFSFLHHTLFQLAMYAIMFFLWMMYLRKQRPLSQ